MATLTPPLCNFRWQAPPFALEGTDGGLHTLETARGPNGLLVMFICNHCPYVQAILDRLIRDCAALKAEGVGSIAIMSNDTQAYPQDGFAAMKTLAEARNFPFPYVLDESQAVARAYGAVCTPDFFGFNCDLVLQYRGRLDASGRQPGPTDARRELFEAMLQIARTGFGPEIQHASMGCSIKWRDEE